MRRLKLSAWRACAERCVQQMNFVVRPPSRSPVAVGDPESLPIALKVGAPGAPPTLTVGRGPKGVPQAGGREQTGTVCGLWEWCDRFWAVGVTACAQARSQVALGPDRVGAAFRAYPCRGPMQGSWLRPHPG